MAAEPNPQSQERRTVSHRGAARFLANACSLVHCSKAWREAIGTPSAMLLASVVQHQGVFMRRKFSPGTADDRLVADLVDERVFPADDVARWPPGLEERMRRFRDHDVAETLCRAVVLAITFHGTIKKAALPGRS